MEQYDPIAVEASRAVLIDALTILGRYAGQLVVVGGWVPELTFPHQGHVGSLDVDLAVDGEHVRMENAYTTIRKLLLDARYRTTDLPSRFMRMVARGGKNVEVKLDLIAGERGTDQGRPRQVQEMSVVNLRGVDLAFDFSDQLEITGTLPEGGRNTVPVRVSDARAFLCMKGICLCERKKEKDAYDVYFTLRKYPGGPAALAERFRPVQGNPLIEEGLRELHSKFLTLEDMGPVWAAQVEEEQGGDRELAQRDAFERVNMLAQLLGLKQ